jgi:hypothetical protein
MGSTMVSAGKRFEVEGANSVSKDQIAPVISTTDDIRHCSLTRPRSSTGGRLQCFARSLDSTNSCRTQTP